jgi:pterin-4a-carbinolamine dehydratase/SAM-dependent methyltransferase
MPCAAPLLDNPKEALLQSKVGAWWVLSFDEKSIERCFVAKNWDAAMKFFNAVALLAEEASHHPDLHLTNWRDVRVVLSTHSAGGLSSQDLELAKKIDSIGVEYSPKWLREQKQPAIGEGTTSSLADAAVDEEIPVTFDANHFKFGLNGNFLQPNAIEAFTAIFEDTEMRDIAKSKHEIVKALRLIPGAVVADVGAGTGLLEPLLSEAVGEEGKIYCSEISPLFRQRMKERFEELQLKNIHIQDDPPPNSRNPRLPHDAMDLVLLVDTYHHLEFPQAALRHIRASLKRHGALIVIDFHRDPARIHSHDEEWVYSHLRADQAAFTKEIETAGFVNVEEIDVPGLPENYCLVFRKRPFPLDTPGAGWAC